MATNEITKTIVLPSSAILTTTYINDVRFDLRPGKAGVAYITDSSIRGPGAIIVVDLDSGDSWRRLSGHPSTSPDPSFIPVVEGKRLAIREKGKAPAPFNVASDGVAISADGATLFYCPLSSRHFYAVPTAALVDRSVSDAEVERAVVDLGEKGASDGLEADDKGRVYAGDYARNNIRQRQFNGDGRPLLTTREFCGPTQCPWLRTAICISRRTSSTARRNSMRERTRGRSPTVCSG